MNPIYGEYLKFLKDNNIDINKYDLKEGYYWLDRQIIKCYDKKGHIHKIIRLQVDDKINLSIKTEYKNKPFEMESWIETVKRNKDRLKQLEEESLKLIKSSLDKYKEHTPIILSSGGKDSSVTTYLVRKLLPNTKIVFNNTSLDCADTYLHIKSLDNVQIINPKEGFYQWRDRLNFIPTRFSRACCSIFKEGAMIDVLDKSNKYLFFMGMRNEESNTRANYGDEWRNDKWSDREWQGILPIRKWTEVDIWLYILHQKINVNNKYKKGYSRCGCSVACPFYSKSTWVLDKYWYSSMYKRWHDILDEDFTQNNKDIIMNCTKEEYHTCWNGGVYRKEPTQEVIEQFANRNGLNINIAEKYFNHTCKCCGKKIKNKEVLAMNMKYIGRNTKDFYCKKHLMEFLSKMYDKPFTQDNWNDAVEKFKEQGCSLF